MKSPCVMVTSCYLHLHMGLSDDSHRVDGFSFCALLSDYCTGIDHFQTTPNILLISFTKLNPNIQIKSPFQDESTREATHFSHEIPR